MNLFRAFRRLGAACWNQLTFRKQAAALIRARKIERMRENLLFRPPTQYRPASAPKPLPSPMPPSRPLPAPVPVPVLPKPPVLPLAAPPKASPEKPPIPMISKPGPSEPTSVKSPPKPPPVALPVTPPRPPVITLKFPEESPPDYYGSMLLRDPAILQSTEEKLRAGARFRIGLGRREDPSEKQKTIQVWYTQDQFWTQVKGQFFQEANLRSLLKSVGC